MIKQFILNQDHKPTDLNKGDKVFEFFGCDYGCVSDDEQSTGIEHTAVTFNPKGDYPFKTVPVHKLTEV